MVVEMYVPVSEISTEGLLCTQESVAYLQEQHPDIKITTDTFAHRVSRNNIPHASITVGKASRWYFKKEDLDKIQFKRPRKSGECKGNVVLPFYEPVAIHTNEDFVSLVDKYGCQLVDDEGLLAALEEKYQYRFSRQSIKQRRHRKTITIAGYSGSRRKQYWYPLDHALSLKWQPIAASLQKVRRRKDMFLDSK